MADRIALLAIVYDRVVLPEITKALSELLARLGRSRIDNLWRFGLFEHSTSYQPVLPFISPALVTTKPQLLAGPSLDWGADLDGFGRQLLGVVTSLRDDDFRVGRLVVLYLTERTTPVVAVPPGFVSADTRVELVVVSSTPASTRPGRVGLTYFADSFGFSHLLPASAAVLDLLALLLECRVLHPDTSASVFELLDREMRPSRRRAPAAAGS